MAETKFKNDMRITGDLTVEGAINASGGNATATVAVADANYTFLAANSGKPHLIANVSADRTFDLPATPTDGLYFQLIATVGAADGHDWIIDAGTNDNFFLGAVTHLDTDADAAGDEIVTVAPDGNSNSILQVNLPQGNTVIHILGDGTNWVVWGQAVSATAPAFSDQA